MAIVFSEHIVIVFEEQGTKWAEVIIYISGLKFSFFQNLYIKNINRYLQREWMWKNFPIQ